MAAHTLDEIVRSDKSMLPAQTPHRQDDAYQAGTSSSSNVALHDVAGQHDYFWTGPVPSESFLDIGAEAMSAYQGSINTSNIVYPKVQSPANSNATSWTAGGTNMLQQHLNYSETLDSHYSGSSHRSIQPFSEPPSQSMYIHEYDVTEPHVWLGAMDEGNHDQHDYSFYGTPAESAFVSHDAGSSLMNQEQWNHIPFLQQDHNTSQSFLATPFETASDNTRTKANLTPGHDAESNQSFYTAVGYIDETSSSPVGSAGGERHGSIESAEHSYDVGVFHCGDCSIDLWDAFEHRRHLRNHMRSHQCQHGDCDKRFPSKNALQRHARTHEKSFPCKETRCNWSFAFEKDLIRHREAKHGFKRPYLCPDPYCKFARDGFKRKDNLKRHIQNAHPGSPWLAAS